MSRGLVERASSDLGHNTYSSTATTTGDDHQCTNNRQRLAFLFSGAGAWRRSEATNAGAETSGGSKKKHVQVSSIGPLVKKYMAMAEQLFASISSGGSGGGRDDDRRRRRSPMNSFSSSSGSGRWSKRHGGSRLFSAPASLRGSPANSGRLSARGIPKASLGESTAEDLQSAIQAAIAHCKNSSIAAAKQQQQAADGDRSTGVN